MRTRDKAVLVGVVPGLPDVLIDTAATFAERFDAELVCATVNGGRYSGREEADGTVISLPFDTASVAAQLTHRHHRPVVVVPQDPVPFDTTPPRQEGRDARR